MSEEEPGPQREELMGTGGKPWFLGRFPSTASAFVKQKVYARIRNMPRGRVPFHNSQLFPEAPVQKVDIHVVPTRTVLYSL